MTMQIFLHVFAT